MAIDVAVVGLNFGAAFVPIYQRHPDVDRVAIVDSDGNRLTGLGERLGVAHRFTDLDDLLATDDWDAVHVTTPVALHARHVLAVLGSGRHCASAVPMAYHIDDIPRIIEAEQTSGLRYMMMETAVFAREFFHARQLHSSGALGTLTFFRGVHIQNLDGFPPYWMGYPPMAYVTHALSPILVLSGGRVERVHCFGSGRLTAERSGDLDNDNPYPVETGIFKLDRGDLAAEITTSFFQTGRSYTEGFSVYGDAGGMEWQQFSDEPPVTYTVGEVAPGHRGRTITGERVEPADRADLLPPEIARFTRPTNYTPPGDRAPVHVAAHHGGSHPHLVHEFVRSIVEQRPAAVDAVTAADWTAPGLCAHRSALASGEAVGVPRFR